MSFSVCQPDRELFKHVSWYGDPIVATTKKTRWLAGQTLGCQQRSLDALYNIVVMIMILNIFSALNLRSSGKQKRHVRDPLLPCAIKCFWAGRTIKVILMYSTALH